MVVRVASLWCLTCLSFYTASRSGTSYEMAVSIFFLSTSIAATWWLVVLDDDATFHILLTAQFGFALFVTVMGGVTTLLTRLFLGVLWSLIQTGIQVGVTRWNWLKTILLWCIMLPSAAIAMAIAQSNRTHTRVRHTNTVDAIALHTIYGMIPSTCILIALFLVIFIRMWLHVEDSSLFIPSAVLYVLTHLMSLQSITLDCLRQPFVSLRNSACGFFVIRMVTLVLCILMQSFSGSSVLPAWTRWGPYQIVLDIMLYIGIHDLFVISLVGCCHCLMIEPERTTLVMCQFTIPPTDPCSICLQEMDNTNAGMLVQCRHTFHHTCILTAFHEHHHIHCPLCRHPIETVTTA